MSKIVYTNGIHQITWASAVVRMLLVRSTSTYTPNRSHDFLSSFTGGNGVEISVASYARQSLANKAKIVDDTNHRIGYDADNVAFGNLEAGQIAKGLILYAQVGGDDSTPNDDILLLYDDGKIEVTAAANAAQNATSLWVEPLEDAIPSGTELVFGSVTATTSAAASRGARSLSVNALSDAITAGTVAANVDTTSIFRATANGAVLQNGAFNVEFPAAGVFTLGQRGLFS